MSKQIHGVIPPVVTPLTSMREVDERSLRRLVSFQLDAGVDAVWALGSCGEFYGLTDAQRATVTQAIVEEVGGRVPVLVGCIDSGTNRCVDAARRAVGLGADAVFTAAPFWEFVTQAELKRHVSAVSEAAGVPTFLYDARYATQVTIEAETVLELADTGALHGVKDSSGDLTTLRMLVVALQGCEDSFTLLTGNEYMMDAALLMGAKGCVTAIANYAPEIFVDLYRHVRAGEWADAARLQNRATGLSAQLLRAWGGSLQESFLGSTKTALRLRGVIDTTLSTEPTVEPTAEQAAEVEAILSHEGLLALR